MVVLGPKALHRSPGLDQRTVHREVLVAHQLGSLGLFHHLSKEFRGGLMLDQPIPIVGECAVIERLLHEVHVQKPSKEEVVPELLAELDLAANRIQGDQQHPLEEALRWN
jgi:hypothetical protein